MKNRVVSKKNLGFVVLVIILTLIVINFGNITGKMIAETDSNLIISIPDVVKSRETMIIKITPGKNAKKGYYPKDIEIVDEDDDIVGHAKITVCHSNYCRKEGETNYILPELKPGKMYYVRVIDWDLGGYVDVPFLVSTPYN